MLTKLGLKEVSCVATLTITGAIAIVADRQAWQLHVKTSLGTSFTYTMYYL